MMASLGNFETLGEIGDAQKQGFGNLSQNRHFLSTQLTLNNSLFMSLLGFISTGLGFISTESVSPKDTPAKTQRIPWGSNLGPLDY